MLVNSINSVIFEREGEWERKKGGWEEGGISKPVY